MLFLLVLVGSTSIAAYVCGKRGLCLGGVDIRSGIGNALDCIGRMIVFLIANTAAGILLVLAGRLATGQFVSLYFADEGLLALSLLQALVFNRRQDYFVERS